MNRISKTLTLSGLLVSVLVASILVVGRGRVVAQELIQSDQSEQQQQQEQQPQQSEEANKDEVYSYVAQPGDSYSLIARKAVQTYGIINKVDLSQSQIIFAETHITQSAGSPLLMKGQKIDVKVSVIKDWVKKAQELTKEQQSAWDVYARRANFDTNKVGQA